MEPNDQVLADQPPTGGDERRESRTDWDRILLILGLVLVIVFLLLFWRQCSTSRTTVTEKGSGEGEIVSVRGLPTDPTTLSLWLKSGASVERVLARHQMPLRGIVSLGAGTFVVTAPLDRSASSVLTELKSDPDVIDAGHVYMAEVPSRQ